MSAYFERRQYVRFKTVLDEMRQKDVIGALRQLGDDLKQEQGLSIAQAEFWSDTLDRWAEDLVDPTTSGACPGSKVEGQPAAVDRPRSPPDPRRRGQPPRGDPGRRAGPPRPRRRGVRQAGQGALEDPGRPQGPGRQGDRADQGPARRRGRVRPRDRPARAGRPSSWRRRPASWPRPRPAPPAIAAETDAIELLLQSKRINPKGGGGGGIVARRRRPGDDRRLGPGPGGQRPEPEGSPRGPGDLAGHRRVRPGPPRGIPGRPRPVLQQARARPRRPLTGRRPEARGGSRMRPTRRRRSRKLAAAALAAAAMPGLALARPGPGAGRPRPDRLKSRPGSRCQGRSGRRDRPSSRGDPDASRRSRRTVSSAASADQGQIRLPGQATAGEPRRGDPASPPATPPDPRGGTPAPHLGLPSRRRPSGGRSPSRRAGR